MRRTNVLVLLVSIFILSLLVIRCTPTDIPIILISEPAYNVPVVAAVDPLDSPIPIAVDVSFPAAANPCGGQNYPVLRSTLVLKLQQFDNLGALVQEWTIDASGWWSTTEDRIQGTITIGGTGSGQSWALYRLAVSISNVKGSATVNQDIRVERPITEFSGGTFLARVVGLTQSPSNCLLPQVAFDVVLNLIQSQTFNVTLPSGSGYPSSIILPLPAPIGTIVLQASIDAPNNNIVFAPVTMSGIDLGPYNISGFNCLVGGTADGTIDGQVSLDNVNATIKVYDMSVGLGSGSGACNLSQPSNTCNLYVTLNGNALAQ